MAKEQFERVKPHVNIGTIGHTQVALEKFGITRSGAFQFMQGQLVTNSEDRKALAGLVSKMLPGDIPPIREATITYTGLE